MGKEVGRDLSPSLHHFVGRDRETKCLFVKLDGEPVTHAQNVSVVFAAIPDTRFVDPSDYKKEADYLLGSLSEIPVLIRRVSIM